jgi:hypothetical protein
LIIVVFLVGYFGYEEIKERSKIKIANQFNTAVIELNESNKKKVAKELTDIIYTQDSTYSPLALYFLIDNNLIRNKDKINSLFDVLINETNLKKEIKYLIIYKKALYNSDFLEENDLIKLLNPIINSESIWQSHSLYLIGEYFFSKKEYQKSKEFFNRAMSSLNATPEIKLKAKQRLDRDFGE